MAGQSAGCVWLEILTVFACAPDEDHANESMSTLMAACVVSCDILGTDADTTGPYDPTQEGRMKMLPQVLFWLGLISVPFAWLVWYFGSGIEIIRPVLANINDPALRAALQEAHAERLGIWVAVWPVSFLVMSQILEKKMQG
jgi:hypothetical protein